MHRKIWDEEDACVFVEGCHYPPAACLPACLLVHSVLPPVPRCRCPNAVCCDLPACCWRLIRWDC